MSDWTRSLSRCEKLSASRIAKAVPSPASRNAGRELVSIATAFLLCPTRRDTGQCHYIGLDGAGADCPGSTCRCRQQRFLTAPRTATVRPWQAAFIGLGSRKRLTGLFSITTGDGHPWSPGSLAPPPTPGKPPTSLLHRAAVGEYLSRGHGFGLLLNIFSQEKLLVDRSLRSLRASTSAVSAMT